MQGLLAPSFNLTRSPHLLTPPTHPPPHSWGASWRLLGCPLRGGSHGTACWAPRGEGVRLCVGGGASTTLRAPLLPCSPRSAFSPPRTNPLPTDPTHPPTHPPLPSSIPCRLNEIAADLEARQLYGLPADLDTGKRLRTRRGGAAGRLGGGVLPAWQAAPLCTHPPANPRSLALTCPLTLTTHSRSHHRPERGDDLRRGCGGLPQKAGGAGEGRAPRLSTCRSAA